MLEEIKKLEGEETDLLEKLQVYKDNDPEILNKMKDDTKVRCRRFKLINSQQVPRKHRYPVPKINIGFPCRNEIFYN